MSKKPFLLDSNMFIAPHRTYYGFDLCPGFWNFLIQEFDNGSIVSIQKVYDELHVGEDVLADWAKNSLGKKHFIDQSKDASVVAKYQDISNWVLSSTQFKDYAKRSFLGPEEADPWICAYAAVHDVIVVTGEIKEPDVKKRVPLPNVLEAFNVEYVDLFSCLRELKARFELVSRGSTE